MSKTIAPKKHKCSIVDSCNCHKDNESFSEFDELEEDDDDDDDDNDEFEDEEDMEEISDVLNYTNQKATAKFMLSLIEAANHKMAAASDLTKLVLSKNMKDMDTNEVFSIFKQAIAVIDETYPLKNFMEKGLEDNCVE